MRVWLRTPAEKVDEYELVDVDGHASDSEILAAAAKTEPLRDGDFEIAGQPYVYARGLDVLAEQGKRLELAGTRLDAEREAARALARRYFEDGLNKQAILTALGITRPTLNAWLAEGGDQ